MSDTEKIKEELDKLYREVISVDEYSFSNDSLESIPLENNDQDVLIKETGYFHYKYILTTGGAIFLTGIGGISPIILGLKGLAITGVSTVSVIVLLKKSYDYLK